MYDLGKIGVGLGIFLVLMTFPIWYNLAKGKATYRVELIKPQGESSCVMPTEYMRVSHMDVIYQWRDEYVRENNKIHVAPNGKRYVKSLSNTCMGCHNNKAEFCDRCHNYAAVEPYCWDCHIEPQGVH